MNTMQLACQWGDVKIGWDDVNDPEIRAIIEKKLAEGYHFFRESEVEPEQQLRIRRVTDVGRHVIIPDGDLHELFTKGKIGIVQTDLDESTIDAGPERLRNADEVMRSRTIAHRALVAG